MKSSSIAVLFASFILSTACTAEKQVRAIGTNGGFVDVKEFIPSAHLDIRYYTTNNFVGQSIDGYDSPKCLLTREAAAALKNVQTELSRKRQSVMIFDCYRPQQAVDHFIRWAKDLSDQKTKSKYYPSIDKDSLFKDGYLAAKSGHSRGSTLDLTIINVETNRELDMGTDFDFFDPLSHTVNSRIMKTQQDNRIALKSVMERNGFKNLDEEWWHYTLEKEPYPVTYFDFKVR